ncbi:MAG: DUF4197 domain-containing protein [Alphaproteobacteria bacterium]|nr:MAG: DUF4197 domain-containing protein [Alphaproteobacteria bacterium]
MFLAFLPRGRPCAYARRHRIRLAIRAICACALLVAASSPAAVAQGGFLDKAREALGGLGRIAPGPDTATPDVEEIAAGLREALRIGAERVVAQVGTLDGFNADPQIHIPLPGALKDVQSVLRRIGMASLADDLELRLNRAAEAAAPQARALFFDAIGTMTLEDARKILDGPDDAATRYFKSRMSAPLAERMTPIVDDSLADVGAIRSYDAMMGRYRAVPFVPDVKADLTSYVVEKALDGIFFYIAREEAAIRNDPARRTSALLRRVFGT